MRSLWILLVVVGFAMDARAAGCESEADAPEIHDAESWKAYKRWCAACNGVVADSLDVAQKEGGCLLPAAPSSTAAGGPMDVHITNAIVAGVSGDISAGDAIVLGGAGLIINSLLAPSTKNPAQEAALAAQEAERQRALETEKAERAQRLLDGMILDDESPEDVSGDSGEAGDLSSQLMTDDPIPNASVDAGGEQSIMGNRRTRLRPRYQPGAVRRSPGPYTPPPKLGLLTDPEPPPKKEAPKATLAGTPPEQAAARGSADGRDCVTRQAALACMGSNDVDACRVVYENAYTAAHAQARAVIETAYRTGVRDGQIRPRIPRRPPQTGNACHDWTVRAYNAGFVNNPLP